MFANKFKTLWFYHVEIIEDWYFQMIVFDIVDTLAFTASFTIKKNGTALRLGFLWYVFQVGLVNYFSEVDE